MKTTPGVTAIASLCLACCFTILLGADTNALPSLRRQGTATQLIVDGQPFLMRAGEVGNSSGEPDYLKPFWPKLVGLRLNTLLVPVYWDLVEPEPGRFDFSTVDGLLADARAHDMRLVLLWFGSWKNSMSCYAPAWVKRDSVRFPRSQDSTGRAVEMLSPFHEANLDADARAFAALMRHLREADGARRTVIMVQVENEIGMIPDARDRSPEADRQYGLAVPQTLMDYLVRHEASLTPEVQSAWQGAGGRRSGTWREVFGAGSAGEEIFMAWHYARFAQRVTERGKAEYALPMFVNAALIRPGHQPGQYPSGGPLPHLFDIWRAGAPAIDLLTPDIYFENFTEWARRYVRGGNPLFVPEALATPQGAINGLFSFATLDAIGFSPFAIESVGEASARAIAGAFDLVAQLEPLITRHQGRGTMVGLIPEGAEQRQPQRVVLGDYVMYVSFERPLPPAVAEGLAGPGRPAAAPTPPAPTGGLVIQLAPDELILGGIGITATFQTVAGGPLQAGLLSVEDGRFVDGVWKRTRWLSGDQTHQGRHVRIDPADFGLRRVKLYTYR